MQQLFRHEARVAARRRQGHRALGIGGLGEHDPGRRRRGGRALARGTHGSGRPSHEGGEGLFDHLGHARGIEPLLLEVVLDGDGREHLLHHRQEGLEHALPLGGHRLHGLAAPEIQGLLQLALGGHVGEVLLVPLEHERHLLGHQTVGEQVDLHVLEGLHVLFEGLALAVRHEDHGVGPRQHHATGGVVLDLARHGVDLHLEVVARNRAEAEGKEVEEKRSVLGGVQGDETVRSLGIRDPVDLLEVGGLAGLGRAVVDDLRLDGPLAEVELDHGLSGDSVLGRHAGTDGLYTTSEAGPGSLKLEGRKP